VGFSFRGYDSNMPLIELPHTQNCVVCGGGNPHGLKLSLFVDEDTGLVETTLTAAPHHVGFEGIIHGGVIAAVVDEAMVWAATWSGKRFCVCGELNVRFRQSGRVGVPVRVIARITTVRSRLFETSCDVMEGDTRLASGTGKYVPLSPERHAEFVTTFVDSPETAAAAAQLR
jgi:uncharacterized protein (TIGR00369 family)